MSIRSEVIWMDGEFYDEAKSVLSHTLHYGLGVFEGIRSYRQSDGSGGVFKLDEHIRRLFDSAKMCMIHIPFTHEEFGRPALKPCGETSSPRPTSGRLCSWVREPWDWGLAATRFVMTVAVWEWGAYLGKEGLKNGIRVGTSSFTRHAVNANLQRAKVIGHYVNSILARYEANENETQAIMLDQSGYVAEGTGENLFVARGNVIKVPSITNILGGICRPAAVQILEHLGYTVIETQFGRDALYHGG